MTFLEFKNIFLFLHHSLANNTPDIPISNYDPSIAKVLSDSKFIDKVTTKLFHGPRRNAKGSVLRQRVGFSKRIYPTLRNLKIFFKILKDSKSPNNNLIIRKVLNLLDIRISSTRNTKDFYEESKMFKIQM